MNILEREALESGFREAMKFTAQIVARNAQIFDFAKFRDAVCKHKTARTLHARTEIDIPSNKRSDFAAQALRTEIR
jgi:hypothetical protein